MRFYLNSLITKQKNSCVTTIVYFHWKYWLRHIKSCVRYLIIRCVLEDWLIFLWTTCQHTRSYVLEHSSTPCTSHDPHPPCKDLCALLCFTTTNLDWSLIQDSISNTNLSGLCNKFTQWVFRDFFNKKLKCTKYIWEQMKIIIFHLL